MKTIIKQKFSVSYQYDIHFTSALFAPENRLLSDFFAERLGGILPKLLVVVDEGVATSHPALIERRSEEHTSELQSLMRISYAVFCLNTKNNEHLHAHLCYTHC